MAQVYVPYVFDVVGVSDIEWGFINTEYTTTMIIVGFFFGKLVDKLGRKNSLVFGYFFIFTPSSLSFLFCRNSPHLLIAYVVFALGGSMIMPAYSALQADMIPRERRCKIMGTIGTLNVLAIVPASALGGFLYDFNPTYPFVFAVVLGVIVGLIVLLRVEEPKIKEV